MQCVQGQWASETTYMPIVPAHIAAIGYPLVLQKSECAWFLKSAQATTKQQNSSQNCQKVVDK